MPSAIDRNAGEGTSMTADSEISTVSPEKSTALPAVSIVSPTAAGCRVVAEAGRAEPDDEEQRVVDAQGEGEHQREVHRPDRDVAEQGAR